jgi:hypothetical protein
VVPPYEAEAASVADLSRQVARQEQEAVEEARRHDEGWKPEAGEEILEVELVVARPAGEDPRGVEEGGDGGEGLKEGEQLEQESEAARSPAQDLSAADALSAPAIHHHLGGGGGGSGFGWGVGFDFLCSLFFFFFFFRFREEKRKKGRGTEAHCFL